MSATDSHPPSKRGAAVASSAASHSQHADGVSMNNYAAPAVAAASPNHTAAAAGGKPALRHTRSTAKAEMQGEGQADTPLFYSILVHNLSHSDLMLGLRAPDGASGSGSHSGTSSSTCTPPLPPSIVARPKFNKFKTICARLQTYVEKEAVLSAVDFPSPLMQANGQAVAAAAAAASHGQGGSAAASAAAATAAGLGLLHHGGTCPYGFRVKDGSLKFADWEGFKLKSEELAQASQRATKPELVGVYFPMLATLVPRWLSIVAGKNQRRGIRHSEQNKKVLFLISGAGTPWNTEHDASGNSTKGVARLATAFLHQFYPDVEVHTLHSGVEIFHYDANVQFVNKELKPRIEEVRKILAEKYYEKWPKYMHLAITLTDGASARISAINASLRHLKPDCLHMWQLKSFWHEYPYISGVKGEADVEYHEFEKLEMTPPTLVSETDNWTKMLVKEMIAHKEEFERVRDSKDRYNELDTFWLRKSKQPVLSVLMVKKKNKGVKFFRGINVEVSMPTGSLCSERNAIGSALSSDPALCRKDLRMIAVLALGLETFATTSSFSANMPLPKELIPIAQTTAHQCNVSPTRVGLSPNYPVRHVSGEVDLSIDANAAEAAAGNIHVELPPALAVPGHGQKPALLRAQSERTIFSQQRKTPPSPAHKGKQGSIGLPPSPQHGATASPARRGSHGEEDAAAATAASGSNSATPRKRKGSSAGVMPSPSANPTPSPVGGGGAHHASSATPPTHSPRLGRNHTVPPAAANGTLSTLSTFTPRDLSAELTYSAMHPVYPSPPPPPMPAASTAVVITSPLSRTRGNGVAAKNHHAAAAAAAASAAAAADENPKKRLRRAPSTQLSAAAAASLMSETHLVPSASTTSPIFSTPSPAGDFSSGIVDDSMQAHYVKHELELIRHRDALGLSPSQRALLSGNLAPNALTPIDRGLSEESMHTCVSSSAAAASSSQGAPPTITDERNPINPCGACNEWLKKIAEVNPDFKVVTFTATDCSTCFIKAVKF